VGTIQRAVLGVRERGRGGGGPDFQQVLARAPSVTLKDLQKGNMIIVVATEGQSPQSATAITVVAGVEPMLQASTSGSQGHASSSGTWAVVVRAVVVGSTAVEAGLTKQS